jgi:hypothetical protein
MSDSLIKQAAMQVLAATIGGYLATVPDGAPLAGRIFVEPAEQGDAAAFPSLRLLPGRFRFERHQDSVEEQLTPQLQLVKCGELVGTMMLRVSETHVVPRERLEQIVRSAFFQEEEVQGRILGTLPPLTLGGVMTTSEATIAFDLDTEDWDDERVFAERLYADLAVEATFPVLVVRSGEQLTDLVVLVQAAIGADLSQDIPDALSREIQVLEDGTVTDY